MLNLTSALVVPAGLGPSRWAGEAMKMCLDYIKPASLFATGDSNGLTAEFPFGSLSSLLQVTCDEQHPTLGSGLHVTLTLPVNDELWRLSFMAGSLNLKETTPDVMLDLFGAWCVSPTGDLCFKAFFPNLYYRPMLGVNLIMGMVARANWIAETFDGGSRRSRWAKARSVVERVTGLRPRGRLK